MRTCMIAAPASGSGKTTITMGLLRALKQRGLDVCGYKTGPDYIDRAFLEAASGKPAGNLDLHLQGEAGVQYALAQAHSEYCVIEGVMGYFDGLYNTWQGSSYDLARRLHIPTVLIYTPGAEMFSIIPKLQGMAAFEQSTIQAVIFNNTTPDYYELIKAAVADYTDLIVLGFVPPMTEVALPSRHLGLVQQREIDDLDQKITAVANALEEHVDISAFLRLMATGDIDAGRSRYVMTTPGTGVRNPLQGGAGVGSCQKHRATVRNPPLTPPRRGIRRLRRQIPTPVKDIDAATSDFVDMPQYAITVAVANDEAFSFYYRENLELLARACQKVIYFSPMRDRELPPCDLVYLGGGYPEVFHAELSGNTAMLAAIKAYAEGGGFVYAECGGFMYLTEAVDDTPMVGVFTGHTRLTSKLQRFGYIDIVLQADCLLGRAGDRLTGHEFHKSVSNVQGQPLYTITKALGTTTWECGYRYKNVLAGYPHLNFLGNLKALKTLLATVELNPVRVSKP